MVVAEVVVLFLNQTEAAAGQDGVEALSIPDRNHDIRAAGNDARASPTHSTSGMYEIMYLSPMRTTLWSSMMQTFIAFMSLLSLNPVFVSRHGLKMPSS